MSKEKSRYCNMFINDEEIPFTDLLEEVEESLSFIKSNRVNTYEMLFEADELLRQAEETEKKNNMMVDSSINSYQERKFELTAEEKTMLDDPEKMIKILKKRRGI